MNAIHKFYQLIHFFFHLLGLRDFIRVSNQAEVVKTGRSFQIVCLNISERMVVLEL